MDPGSVVSFARSLGPHPMISKRADLAARGFLLADTIPFALRYTSAKRTNRAYLDLVRSSRDYFYSKLFEPRLIWAADVRVALAFKLHGLRLIEALQQGLRLGDRSVFLVQRMIATDSSNYTSPEQLRRKWELPDE